ncbi:hypothetical protein BG006_004005 [Podila minutissima]|uniref:Uncharacterized protein n=1 Tax=Podila minutissima TaxID=64525 RepID=A0A9P5VG87_9FUNG|nr:hypothetical protein BG006_004005 [Podila minutissima]
MTTEKRITRGKLIKQQVREDDAARQVPEMSQLAGDVATGSRSEMGEQATQAAVQPAVRFAEMMQAIIQPVAGSASTEPVSGDKGLHLMSRESSPMEEQGTLRTEVKSGTEGSAETTLSQGSSSETDDEASKLRRAKHQEGKKDTGHQGSPDRKTGAKIKDYVQQEGLTSEDEDTCWQRHLEMQ